MKHLTNNFDFLRLFAALCVLASHQYALLGLSEPVPLPGQSLGGLGVIIFFTISGYLITKSWLSDPNILRFSAKRILRIWPALTVFTVLCAFVLGPCVTQIPLSEYFRSPGLVGFFNTLRMRIVFSLPGVFPTNPYPSAINGSLWTIPLEVKCYCILLALGVLRILTMRWIILACTLALAVYYFIVLDGRVASEDDYMMRFSSYFCAGACAHLFRERRKDGRAYVVIALVMFAGLAAKKDVLAQWALLPFAIISIGEASTPVLRRFGRYGDLSYGAYIYAFGVQQTVIWITRNSLSFYAYLALSLIITLAFAYLSWHFVERPALRLKPRGRPTVKGSRNDETLPDVPPADSPSGR
ncbi:acyltransferase family protein [Paraburkholderia sp. SOS3]|uniref:acyltransferase family protein n=1 Tax=Paraburkholderia sp. SOS3 TaxID=1926494 RepID=UPI0009473146|nr:acyltransferase [Paraburkholderia sp. SOS3]APR35221.1 hypothetical protein BTO02_07025 [Paraburkholderia sp. SOS3]